MLINRLVPEGRDRASMGKLCDDFVGIGRDTENIASGDLDAPLTRQSLTFWLFPLSTLPQFWVLR